MYIYFDSNGTIKEIVNDLSIRKGSADYNKLYVYIEGEPEIDDIWYFQKFPNGSTSNEVSFVDDVVTKAIPYDAKRDLTYFKDFVQYKFYVFTLTSEYLNISGLAIGTIRIAVDNSIFALGELTFNIQANEVNADNNITQSQYDYLLLAYASRTLSEQTGSDLDTLLDEKIEAKATDIIEPIFDDYKSTIDDEIEAQNEAIASLSQASPSVFDTASNIGNLQENKGVAVATDTGYIYYWDSTLSTPAYVSSGLQYNSLADYVTHVGNQLKDENNNDIYPYIDDKEIYNSIDNLNNSSQEIIDGWTKPSNKYLKVVDVTTVDINNPSTAQNNDFQYVIVECKVGDKFIVNGYDGLNMRSWCFTDASYNVLTKSIYNDGNQNHRYIVAPTNAKYLIIQRRLTLNNNPSYKNINLPNNYYNNLFEYGGINQTGVLSVANDRMRSIDFISDNIEYIETASNTWAYSLWVRFYDANGDIDSSFGNTYNVNYVNFDELRALYPTYKFKVVLRLDQLGDTPFNNMYIKFKNTFVENKERTIYESKNNYKNLMFYPYKFKKEAHRGLSNVYPQNTLKAFIGAAEQDFIYGIETDVQMTSDNVLLCFHDDTLDALTTGTGAVSSYTWDNLQNVVYDNTPGSSTYPNEKIPKFEDYLKICRKYGKVPYIEIKNLDMNGIKYLVELVRKMGFVNRCVFTSFNLNHIKYLSYLAKNDFFIEYMVNNGTTIETAISQAKPYNVNALRFNYADITEELVNTAHENNYLIDCWGLNVGNTSAYDNLIDCGAEGCTCDSWEWAD